MMFDLVLFLRISRYVPALHSNCTVEVQFLPLCFAPVLPASKGLQAAHLVHVADSCFQHCHEGEDPCSREQEVTFETKKQKGKRRNGKGHKVEKTSMCLFVKQPKRQLMATKEGSLSGTGTALVTWLRDTLLSSKSAELRFAGPIGVLHWESFRSRLVEDPKEAEAKDEHVSHQFSVTEPAGHLLMRNMLLSVATTEDQTDAEKQVVLLRIVPHPPPTGIFLRRNVTKGFLVPDFDIAQQRSNYAACMIGNPTIVEGVVPDPRFEIASEVVILGKSCLGDVKKQKRFSAVRADQSCTYCQSYQPWNEDYDVAATLSDEQCLYDAIDLGDNNKLQKIATTIADHYSEHTTSCYEVIPRAIHVGRTDTTMLKTLLDNKFDPSCAGCPDMPLQAAASRGFVSAMEMLLDWNFALFSICNFCFSAAVLQKVFHFEFQPEVFPWYVFWFWLFNSPFALRCPPFKAQDDLTRSKISCFFESDCWLSLATNVGSISINFLLFDPTQVRRKADVNAMDAKNGTAFLRASQHCQLGALQLLLDHGAGVDQLVPPPLSTRKRLWRRMISSRMHFFMMPGWCIDDVDLDVVFRLFPEMIFRWCTDDLRIIFGWFIYVVAVSVFMFPVS